MFIVDDKIPFGTAMDKRRVFDVLSNCPGDFITIVVQGDEFILCGGTDERSQRQAQAIAEALNKLELELPDHLKGKP